MLRKILLIAKNWPEPNSTAAGRRTLTLLSLFAEQGMEIHIASAADTTPFQADFEALKFHCHRIELNSSSFDTWICDLDPQLIIFDRFVTEEQFGWRVKKNIPRAMTLLDTSDLHCLRYAREMQVKKQQPFTLFNDIAQRELVSIARCDIALMISRIEIDLLKQHFGLNNNQLAYLPFIVDENDFLQGPDFEERQHCIMIGGFKHEPNRDAALWLKKDIWPLLKKQLPAHCEMHVYGAYADHAINQLTNKADRFFIKGRADNAMATMAQYRINLAPLRFGAGQKGKILEGWLTGTPTISTDVGLESMVKPADIGYDIPKNESEFANVCAETYVNPERWQTLADQSGIILRKNFWRSEFGGSFVRQINESFEQLNELRAANFWGSVLWQQQFRASEFMSRWIELKNT